jgi:hypothetical protein
MLQMRSGCVGFSADNSFHDFQGFNTNPPKAPIFVREGLGISLNGRI